MSTTAAKMTVEEFLTLPDDPDVHRELIHGEIVDQPVSTRNPRYAGAVAEVPFVLRAWIGECSVKHAYAGSGEVRSRLPNSIDTTVGIDVGLFIGDDLPRQVEEDMFMSDSPILAVEVLSASDTHDSASTKIRLYLDSGVSRVWIADPDFCTVTVCRANQEPQLRNSDERIGEDLALPDFSADAAACFSQLK